jgi:hypothetical protein
VGTTSQPLTNPDDLVHLGHDLFIAFQNGVGAKGEPSPTGNAASTIVEMTTNGTIVHQWDVTGKVDGMGGDPAAGRLYATVDEDGSSSFYRLDPSGSITHYAYDRSPLPHGGGTDAVSVVDGTILVSASAPTMTSGPAVYAVTLQDPATPGGTGIAHVRGAFSDAAPATPLNPGAPSQLALTDPDSNTVVPQSVPGVGGDFMLDSQGDRQEVFVKDPTSAAPQLSVLAISQSVDDTAFPTSPGGKLIATDPTHDTVVVITGFQPGRAYSSVTPCDANHAATSCPANSLGTLDLRSGTVTPVTPSGAAVQPSGLIYVAPHQGERGHGGQDGGDQGGDGHG